MSCHDHEGYHGVDGFCSRSDVIAASEFSHTYTTACASQKFEGPKPEVPSELPHRHLQLSAMSRMSQKELRAEIQRLGEDPPAKWTKAELQHRLSELYVEKDVAPPGQKPQTALR